jgi:hypothetical protein
MMKISLFCILLPSSKNEVPSVLFVSIISTRIIPETQKLSQAFPFIPQIVSFPSSLFISDCISMHYQHNEV